MRVKMLFYLRVLLYCILLTLCYSGKLLFSTYDAIMEFDFDTRSVTVLLKLGGSTHVYAIDYDYINRHIYFPRHFTNDIVRFAYPKKIISIQTVVETDQYPTGIAVDSANDHIYWITLSGILSKCNLDGTIVSTVTSSLINTWVIRLDITNRWLYVAEQNKGILKSRFDLAEQQRIVNFTSTPVYCMDIDTDESTLYWMSSDGNMTSARDDGSDLKTVLSTNVHRTYDDIGVFGSYVYYPNNNQLLMASKSAGSTPTVLYSATSEINSIYYVFNSSG